MSQNNVKGIYRYLASSLDILLYGRGVNPYSIVLVVVSIIVFDYLLFWNTIEPRDTSVKLGNDMPITVES